MSLLHHHKYFYPPIGPLEIFEKAKELKEVNLYAAKHLIQKLLRSPSVQLISTVADIEVYAQNPEGYK